MVVAWERALAADPVRQDWFFGVFCERCTAFIAVRRDDSGGRAGAKLATSGTIIATCHGCGHRGRYAANRVEQRRAEPRSPIARDGAGGEG